MKIKRVFPYCPFLSLTPASFKHISDERGILLSSQETPEVPWHSKPPKAFLAVLREHIHHSPAHLSPSALYLNTESVKRCLLQNWLFVQAHTATLKHLKKAGEQNWPAKPRYKVLIKSREQWIQEDPLETQYTSGAAIRLMCQVLSWYPGSPLNANYLMLLPLSQCSEIHSWKGFTWNYLKITSLFYASRKYAWISSLLIIPPTHTNLIIINTPVNFQISLSFPCYVSSELIRVRLFSPNNYHESGFHESGNSWRIYFWHHVA